MEEGGARNIETVESVDVAQEVKDLAVAEGFTVFGEEAALGFGVLNPKNNERYYYLEGRLFGENEMPEEGVALNISNAKEEFLKKVGIAEQK